jgi:hypothetical protein
LSEPIDDVQQYVTEMAKAAVLSDRLNEIQERNLKLYPLVFFEAVRTAEIDYDFSARRDPGDAKKKAPPRVAYNLRLDESRNPDADKRFKLLELAVRRLLWKDLVVKLSFNGTLKFESEKR